MFTPSDDLVPVLRAVDLLLCELASLDQEGPAITIIHRYRVRVGGAQCQPGEEVARIVVTSRGRHAVVRLGLACRLLFDFIARFRHVPHSAVQISSQMRLMEFYRQHGLNIGILRTRKISQSSVREYVRRIRRALAQAFAELGLPIEPSKVLISEVVGKEVLYSLRASVQWHHVNEINERMARARRAI